MARLMLSAGMFSLLAARMAVRRRGLLSGSPPPFLAAMLISLIRRVKILPRLASSAPFLCLIVAHLEWPDMDVPSPSVNVSGPDHTFVQGRLVRQNALIRDQESPVRDGHWTPRLPGFEQANPDYNTLKFYILFTPRTGIPCSIMPGLKTFGSMHRLRKGREGHRI